MESFGLPGDFPVDSIYFACAGLMRTGKFSSSFITVSRKLPITSGHGIPMARCHRLQVTRRGLHFRALRRRDKRGLSGGSRISYSNSIGKSKSFATQTISLPLAGFLFAVLKLQFPLLYVSASKNLQN
jgi:hypothetical protein